MVSSKGPTAKASPVEDQELERRLKIIRDIVHNTAILQSERWKNWQGQIMIDSVGLQPDEWIGHTTAYKPVVVEGKFNLGDVLAIKITKIIKTGTVELRAEVRLDVSPGYER